MRRHGLCACFVILLVICLWAQVSFADGKITLKLASEMADGTPEDIAVKTFASNVKAKTNGEIDINVYPNGQLGEPATVIESAQLGNVDIVILPASDFKSFGKIFGVEAIPYLYANNQTMTKILFDTGIAKMQQDLLAKNDLILLNKTRNYYRGPYRVLVSKKPVESLADFKGLRFRTFEDKNYMKAYDILGANPIVMAWSETYTGIKSGVVEAATSAVMNLRKQKLTEVAPHVTNVNEYVSTILILANSSKFNSLSDKDKKIIMYCADQVGKDVNKEVSKTLNSDITALKKAGVKFYEIDTAPIRAKLKDYYYSLEKDGTLPKGTVDKVFAIK